MTESSQDGKDGKDQASTARSGTADTARAGTAGTDQAGTADTSPPAPRKLLRGPVVVIGVFGVMLSLTLGAIVAPTLALRAEPVELDDYGQLPAFQLDDHTGAALTDRDLRGKVVIANFIFTRCITVCPVFTVKMRRVQDRTPDIKDQLKLVSFSVDPGYDTPAVLAAYAEVHGADPLRWRFVTGDEQAVRAVVTGGLAMSMDRVGQQVDGTPDVAHSEHFVLLDQVGRIRGYYDANDAKRIERMLRDARWLIKRGP